MILSNRPSQINVFNYWTNISGVLETGTAYSTLPLRQWLLRPLRDRCHDQTVGKQEEDVLLDRQFTKLYTKKVIYTLLDCAQAFWTTRKVFLKTVEGLEGQTNLAYIGELFLAGSKFQRQVH